MNIVQAYTKFNNGLVILISGFSGSKKTIYSRFLANLFNFKLADLESFHVPIEVYDKEENYQTLKDGTKILKWDNIYDSIDWNKFNSYVEEHKKNGLIIHGFGFPSRLLNFTPEFNILIKISKQNLLMNRSKYIESHTADESEILKKIDQDRSIVDSITFPLYLKISEESKFNHIINTNNLTEDQSKDDIFNYTTGIINKMLEKYNGMTLTHKDEVKTDNQSFQSGRNSHLNHPKVHHDGNSYYYDEFYYPNKKRVLYDFNDEGIEYSDEYRKRFNADDSSSVSTTDSLDDFEPESELNTSKKHKKSKRSKRTNNSSSSSESDATFLFTTSDDNF